MAGVGIFLNSAIQRLVDGLEAGTEEGVRMELKKIKRHERVAEEEEKEKARLEAEKKRVKVERRKKPNKRIAQEEVKERLRVKTVKKRVEVGRRNKRDQETAFWTTPGKTQRPLAEPPILD